MINEEACLMPSLKECKRFMMGFDALFVQDHELWFGKYLTPFDIESDPDIINLYSSSGTSLSMLKKYALCFFDKDSHRWVMILSDHCRITWQVNTEDDEIYLRMLASIAEDEIKGSREDLYDFAITNRIKNRYKTWFEKGTLYRRMARDRINTVYGLVPTTATFDEFPLKPTPPQPTIYQLPQPKLVQFNDDYTTVVWKDGTHTTVKRTRGDAYDEEKAVAIAVIKKMCGDNGCEMDRYFNKFFEHSVDISNTKKKKGAKKK